MIKSKPWNWNVSDYPYWREPDGEMYPLINRWKRLGFRKVLDLGCGVGRHAILFAENDFEVDACDLSKEGIEKLDNFANSNKLKIITKVTDMLSLPYKNQSFDALIAFHAIYHTDNTGIKKVLGEIKRVLKEGGEAFITFNSQNSTAFKDPANTHLSDNTICKTVGNEKGIPHFYTTKAGVEKLLKDFKIIEFSYKEEYWQDSDYTGAHYFVLIKKK